MQVELLSRVEGVVPAFSFRSSAKMPQSDPRWLDVLRACGEETGALVVRNGGEIAGWLPFATRRASLGTVLTSQPYLAYGGAIARDDDESIVRALLAAYVAHARDEGAAAVTLGTPPFLAIEPVWRDAFAPSYVTENFVQLSALGVHPLEQLPSKRRTAIKGHLRAANAYRVERTTSRAHFDAWRAIYERRYEELGAVAYPARLHEAVFDMLIPSGAAELWVALHDGELAGGTLFLVDDVTVDYFASVYSSEHRHAYPQDLVLDAAFREFVARGLTQLNWESSPSKGGVFAFKAGWGAYESRHFYYSRVLDESILYHTPAEIREAFPLRFVVPFSELR